jgi:hypothetical protein
MGEELLRLGGAEGVPVLAGLGKPLTEGRIGLMFGNEGRGLLEGASPRSRTESDPDPAQRVDALALAIEAARPESERCSAPACSCHVSRSWGARPPRWRWKG